MAWIWRMENFSFLSAGTIQIENAWTIGNDALLVIEGG